MNREAFNSFISGVNDQLHSSGRIERFYAKIGIFKIHVEFTRNRSALMKISFWSYRAAAEWIQTTGKKIAEMGPTPPQVRRIRVEGADRFETDVINAAFNAPEGSVVFGNRDEDGNESIKVVERE